MGITQLKQQKEKKKNLKTKDSLRDLCNNIMCTNIHIIGYPEGEETEKGTQNLFEEIMTVNFSILEKETEIQVQETQRVPNERTQRDPHQDTL